MKLRVKLGRESKVIEFADRNPSSVTLGELLQDVSSQFELEAHDFELSLNKQDSLSGPDRNLSDFDLVSGDLLHIIGNDLPVREPGPAPSRNPRRQPLATYSSRSEPSVLQDQSRNEHRENTLGGQVSAAPMANVRQEPAMSSSDTAIRESGFGSSEQIVSAHTENADPNVNRYLLEPLTVRESSSTRVPALLDQLYCSADCTSLSDALWVAVHALMVEAGFVPLHAADVTQMPEGWKRAGFYTCSYTYNVSHTVSNTCAVSGVTLGASLAVHALSQASDEEFNSPSLQLTAGHFVRELCDAQTASVYRALDRLSLHVRDCVCVPLVNYLVTAAGYRERQGFLALPWEVTLRILTYLDASSLCRLGQTCHELKMACRDNMVWRHCFIRDFGMPSCASLPRPWHQLYKESFAQALRRAEEQRRHESIFLDPTWPPHAPYPLPFHPQPYPFHPSHMIGGEYDLVPGGVAGLPPPQGRGGNNPLQLPGQPRGPRGRDPFSLNPLQPGRRGGNMTGSPFHNPFGGGPFT